MARTQEPKPARTQPAPGSRGPHTPDARRGRRDELRESARGLSYAEGAALLQPRDPAHEEARQNPSTPAGHAGQNTPAAPQALWDDQFPAPEPCLGEAELFGDETAVEPRELKEVGASEVVTASSPQSTGARKAAGGGGGKAVPDGTGMASRVAIDRFIVAAKKTKKDWGTLDKNARARRYTDAANGELGKTGAPALGPSVKDIGSANGELDFTAWKLDVSERLMNRSAITDDEAASVADTIYHEARHGEQWYRMARLLAGKGKNAAAIRKEMFVPDKVAKAAEKDPLKGNSVEAKEAAAWHRSVYGSGAKKRNEVLKSLGPLRAKVVAARKTYKNAVRDLRTASVIDPQAGLVTQGLAVARVSLATLKAVQAQISLRMAEAAFGKAYQAYRNLPEEVDAWKAGGRVEARYKGEEK